MQDWIGAAYPSYLSIGYAVAGGITSVFVVFAPSADLGSQHGTEPALLRISSLYRRMGWCGVVWYATLYLLLLQIEFGKPARDADPVAVLMCTIACGVFVLLFLSMLRTADGLELDFPRNYHRAKWTGILADAVYFPWLTIPGSLVVRRLEEYRRNIEADS